MTDTQGKFRLGVVWGLLGLLCLILVGGLLRQPLWVVLAFFIWLTNLICLATRKNLDELEALAAVQVVALFLGLILALTGIIPYPWIFISVVVWVIVCCFLLLYLMAERYLGIYFVILGGLESAALVGIGPTVFFTLYHPRPWLPWLLAGEAAIVSLIPALMALEEVLRLMRANFESS